MKYWSSSNTNIGDAITPFILNSLGYTTKYSPQADIVCAGSIIGFKEVLENKPLIIGSGFLNSTDKIPNMPATNILALRGKLSANKLKASNCILGDFGLLLSKCYPIKTEKKYKYGIICHCTDYKEFKQIQHFNGPIINAQFNSPLTEQKIIEFVTTLNECECILSSSLHGIVFTHSYGIPAIYLKNLNNPCKFDPHVISQDDFKFKDYYSALSIDYTYTIFNSDFNNIDLSPLAATTVPTIEEVTSIQNNLLECIKQADVIRLQKRKQYSADKSAYYNFF